MPKAPLQHRHITPPTQVAQRKNGQLAAAVHLPLAQLTAMAERSSQVEKSAQLATIAKRSSQVRNLTQMAEMANDANTVSHGARTPNRTGLPDQLKSGVESLSGMSLDNVRVHYNSSQPAQLNAHAYAQGTDIHLAPGQEKHLPHEAWHVVQQAQGRVKPTMQMKTGVPVNDDIGLEREADVMGAKALQGGLPAPAKHEPISLSGSVMQGVLYTTFTKHVSQKGKFLGDPAAYHIHDVGGVMHFKYGTDDHSRENFGDGGWKFVSGLEKAIETCSSYDHGTGSDVGKAEVLALMRGLLAPAKEEEARRKPKPVPVIETPVESESTTVTTGKPTRGGKGGLSKTLKAKLAKREEEEAAATTPKEEKKEATGGADDDFW